MSKYEPLSRRLRGHPADEWRASFSEIEDVLGFALPKSARQHRAWWANEANANHPHKRSWLAHGWQTQDVDQAAGLVTFRRGDIAPAAVAAALDPVGEIPAERMPKPAKPPAAALAPPPAKPRSPRTDDAVENFAAASRLTAHPVALVAGVAAAVTVVAGLGLLAWRHWSARD